MRKAMLTLIRFLRADLFSTRDGDWADRSSIQFRIDPESPADAPVYTTSILGVINGGLTRLGIVLVVCYEENGPPVPPYFQIRRVWWSR